MVCVHEESGFYADCGKISYFPDHRAPDPKQGYLGDQNIDYYLNGTIADLHDGMLMKNMDTAVEILEEKIREGEKNPCDRRL